MCYHYSREQLYCGIKIMSQVIKSLYSKYVSFYLHGQGCIWVFLLRPLKMLITIWFNPLCPVSPWPKTYLPLARLIFFMPNFYSILKSSVPCSCLMNLKINPTAYPWKLFVTKIQFTVSVFVVLYLLPEIWIAFLHHCLLKFKHSFFSF